MYVTEQRLLYRPREVAIMLGLAKSTVFNLIKQGSLPSKRIGRAVRVPADGLERWLRERDSNGR